jgi:antitoxin (DNA-binding transcriptional repressor) of toxin-antitoxin stability system
MGRVTAVGVKELKNRLSSYLKEVQAGTVVLVTDRGTVVAELREPSVPRVPVAASVEEEWVRVGALRPPRFPRSPCPPSPVERPEGTAQRLLDAERSE